MNQRFKKVKNSLRMNNIEMGEIMGIDQSTISKIEKGKVKPTIKSLQNLHERKRINLNYLLCGEGLIFDTNELSQVNESTGDYNNYRKKWEEVIEENRILNKKLQWYLENCECKKEKPLANSA